MLEAVIKFRWMALPQEQREGIKNYVATVVIKARAAATVAFRHAHPLHRALARARSLTPRARRLRAADVVGRGDVSARPDVH